MNLAADDGKNYNVYGTYYIIVLIKIICFFLAVLAKVLCVRNVCDVYRGRKLESPVRMY